MKPVKYASAVVLLQLPLRLLTVLGLALLAAGSVLAADVLPSIVAVMDQAKAKDWLARWEKGILQDARGRPCDRELGEELGWIVTPFLEGFHYGYVATHDSKWIDLLADWADAISKRGVGEPDGFIGWPKVGATGTEATKELYTDSQLGEAMMLRPLLLMAVEVRKTPALQDAYAAKATAWVALAERVFAKWDARGCWRTVKDSGLWVVLPFGIEQKTGTWTAGYATKDTGGFSLPDNKQNLIATWLLALFDATQKPVYKDRAEAWFRLMKSRMTLRDGGKYLVWNYWDPAGPWDVKADGAPAHWIGVHPNGGYYGIDLDGIICAYEHGLVFTKDDVARLVATNRDFMWNQQVKDVAFKRIDGEKPDPRWAKTPGVLWTALLPYDATLRTVFEANHDPASWGGMAETPRYLARFAPGLRTGR